EGVVGAALAGGTRRTPQGVPRGQAVGIAAGVQALCASVRALAVPACAGGSEVGVSTAVVQSVPAALLPLDGCAALLRANVAKSASGCADPLQRQERPRGKRSEPCCQSQLGRSNHSGTSGRDAVRYEETQARLPSQPAAFACLRASRARAGEN